MLLQLFVVFHYYTIGDLLRQRAESNRLAKEAEEESRPSLGSVRANGLLAFVGLLVLVVGARFTVTAGESLARGLGVSDEVIGLTILAIGTSLPELTASVIATRRGHAELAIGNVVGSNIANIALILGIGAMIRPIRVQMRLLVREVPLMILATMAFYVLALDQSLQRWDGAILLVGFVAYTLYLLKGARMEPPAIEVEYQKFVPSGGTLSSHILLTVLGLGTLLGGAQMVVSGASEAARFLGISELAVGLTVVAIGTSLPELATAIAASVQDEGDILVGNVVGSNVFNVLAVLGTSSLARPLHIAQSVIFVEAPVMIVVSILLLPFVWSTLRVTRSEGVILVAAYVAFVIVFAIPH